MRLRLSNIVALAAMAATVCTASAAAGSSRPVREHVDLKLVKKSGASRFEHSGRASGTFTGAVRSKISIAHSVVLSGAVSIKTSGGTVRLKVKGRARSLSLRTKFDGTATISGGTGRYARAKGTGRFTGVVNRKTWHATLDATGSFSS
jgi:hypothetical protein